MSILFAAEEVHSVGLPPVMYGVIAMGVFLLLGFVTYTYRDVANRHDHKSGDSSGHH